MAFWATSFVPCAYKNQKEGQNMSSANWQFGNYFLRTF